ncbi:MAG: alkaline phosphatase family protein [Planctomycetota bacterium]|jgi:hypothetical protein
MTVQRPSIASVTPTLCALLGVEPPGLSEGGPLSSVLNGWRETWDERLAERCLVFAPDAIGEGLVGACRDRFLPVQSHAPLEVPLRAEIPTVTPVCFASMFTGAPPEAHAIRAYEKPVLECDTLFDALLRAGKNVAIATVKDSSIDRIFRGRELDHYSEDYDPEVTARGLDLIEEDRHDFLLVYHQEYDDTMHATAPRDAKALRAMENHVRSFDRFARAAKSRWGERPGVLLFAPDHGTHVDPETGRGTHGEAIPEDLEVLHFFGFTVRG